MGDLREEIAKGNARFGEYVRKGDVAGLASLYTADACLMPANSPAIVGREKIREFWGAAAQAMGIKDAVLTTVELVGEGDTVAVAATFTGTHTAPLRHIDRADDPPTNKKGRAVIHVFYRIADGKFVESWEVLEQMTMMQQLGVIPT